MVDSSNEQKYIVGWGCEIADEWLTRGARNEIHICDSNMNGSYEREAISRRYPNNEIEILSVSEVMKEFSLLGEVVSSIQSYPSPEFLNSLPFIKKFFPTPLWGEGYFSKTTHENSCNLRHSEAHSPSAKKLQKTRRSARLFCNFEDTFNANENSSSRKNPASLLHNTSKLKGIYMKNLTETVFSRFTSHFSLPKVAFTLAEVLITLGIIGVVAALTLPSVITNYQKKQTATQLKKVYTTLSQAIEHAKADYGDVSTWGLGEAYGTSATGANGQKFVTEFSQKYVIPYLAKAKDSGYTTIGAYGYDEILNIGGERANIFAPNDTSYLIVLSDGTVVGIRYDTINMGTAEHRNDIIWAVTFWTDLNGLKGPNVIGHDIFLFKMNLQQNAKFMPYYYENESYGSTLVNCQRGGLESRSCTGLIMLDGWEIKDHYPWKYK